MISAINSNNINSTTFTGRGAINGTGFPKKAKPIITSTINESKHKIKSNTTFKKLFEGIKDKWNKVVDFSKKVWNKTVEIAKFIWGKTKDIANSTYEKIKPIFTKTKKTK